MTTRSAFERLCKWRQVFAGWQLGTRLSGDPECQAVRDHREVTICLRAEVNGLTKLLVDKGIATAEEVSAIFEAEAQHLSEQYERKFPGMKAMDWGIEMKLPEAAETMKGWKP